MGQMIAKRLYLHDFYNVFELGLPKRYQARLALFQVWSSCHSILLHQFRPIIHSSIIWAKLVSQLNYTACVNGSQAR